MFQSWVVHIIGTPNQPVNENEDDFDKGFKHDEHNKIMRAKAAPSDETDNRPQGWSLILCVSYLYI